MSKIFYGAQRAIKREVHEPVSTIVARKLIMEELVSKYQDLRD